MNCGRSVSFGFFAVAASTTAQRERVLRTRSTRRTGPVA
jgi:hypothetical protein